MGVRRLIARAVGSPEHLELLLLVARTEPRTWSTESASAALRLDPAFTQRRFHDLVDARLVAECTDGAHGHFVFAPIHSVDRHDVSLLQMMYDSDPETVTRAVYNWRPLAPRSIGEGLAIHPDDSR